MAETRKSDLTPTMIEALQKIAGVRPTHAGRRVEADVAASTVAALEHRRLLRPRRTHPTGLRLTMLGRLTIERIEAADHA